MLKSIINLVYLKSNCRFASSITIKQLEIMYYEEIDPIGESDVQEYCSHCDAPDVSYRGYCSKACYNYDTE